MKNYFAKNISYLIDNNIISVETILKITNHNSPGLISMWKSGERNIMTNDLIAIANFLNYTVDDLINKDLSKKDSKLSKSETLSPKIAPILALITFGLKWSAQGETRHKFL